MSHIYFTLLVLLISFSSFAEVMVCSRESTKTSPHASEKEKTFDGISVSEHLKFIHDVVHIEPNGAKKYQKFVSDRYEKDTHSYNSKTKKYVIRIRDKNHLKGARKKVVEVTYICEPYVLEVKVCTLSSSEVPSPRYKDEEWIKAEKRLKSAPRTLEIVLNASNVMQLDHHEFPFATQATKVVKLEEEPNKQDIVSYDQKSNKLSYTFHEPGYMQPAGAVVGGLEYECVAKDATEKFKETVQPPLCKD